MNQQLILPTYDERSIGPRRPLETPLRRAVDRRSVQVEIVLGIPIEDMCRIYRTQFVVMYGYHNRDIAYDANGRLVRHSVLPRCHQLGEP